MYVCMYMRMYLRKVNLTPSRKRKKIIYYDIIEEDIPAFKKSIKAQMLGLAGKDHVVPYILFYQ